jgi:hypothetical protein
MEWLITVRHWKHPGRLGKHSAITRRYPGSRQDAERAALAYARDLGLHSPEMIESRQIDVTGERSEDPRVEMEAADPVVAEKNWRDHCLDFAQECAREWWEKSKGQKLQLAEVNDLLVDIFDSMPSPSLLADAAAWQPIETAPKDGTEILGWDDCAEGPTVISWNDRWQVAWDATEYRPQPLTHWRPLPPPPAKP